MWSIFRLDWGCLFFLFFVKLFWSLRFAPCAIIPNLWWYIYGFMIVCILALLQPTIPLFRTIFFKKIPLSFRMVILLSPKKARIPSTDSRHSFLGTPLEGAFPLCEVSYWWLGFEQWSVHSCMLTHLHFKARRMSDMGFFSTRGPYAEGFVVREILFNVEISLAWLRGRKNLDLWLFVFLFLFSFI